MNRTTGTLLILLHFTSIGYAQGSFLTPRHSDYELVVIGAGPAGLSAANAAISRGIPAEKVLVLEKRDEQSYGQRTRVVVVEGTSLQIFKESGAQEPGVRLSQMVTHLSGGRVRYYPNRGLWKKSIAAMFGDRSLDALDTIGGIENELLNTYRRWDGEIIFASQWSLIKGLKNRYALQVGNKVIESRLIVDAGGANNPLSHAVPKINVAESTTSHFLSMDLSLVGANHELIRSGDVANFTLRDERAMVYVFVAKDSASVNMMLPAGITPKDLDAEPALRERYFARLKATAEIFGLRPLNSSRGFTYSGTLSMLDRVMAGNVVFIGEAARSTDAISGAGMNAAVLDGYIIGQYFEDLRSLGPEQARTELVDGIKSSTRKAFEYSLLFRELAQIAIKKPNLLESAHLIAALNSRQPFGSSLMDFGKSLGMSLLGISTPDRWVDGIMQTGVGAVGVPGPFKSSERERTVGDVHPRGGTEDAGFIKIPTIRASTCRELFQTGTD